MMNQRHFLSTRWWLLLGLAGWMMLLTGPVQAEVKSLDALLKEVKHARHQASKQNSAREKTFKQARDQRASLLKKAKAQLAQQKKRSATLKTTIKTNEQTLIEIEHEITEKGAALGELFGVVRQIAGEVSAAFKLSIVSAEYADRATFLKTMADSRSLPSMADLNQLWFLMQQQMTVSGKVSRFTRTVITAGGEEQEKTVVRVGEFNVIAEGAYLQFLPKTQQLVELSRQPPELFLGMAKTLAQAQDGQHAFGLDPSRGALLALLTQVPNLEERVHQGGIIGYVILGIGVLALLVSLERYVYLGIVGFKIKRQKKRQAASAKNPLGRILQAYDQRGQQDVEMLSLKLDEAILRETPRLERRLVLLGIFATICPLLGLLGTVTGMIETFQSIAIFGTGDPKLMSSGISQALVTTGLGLVVAVPVILLHGFLQGKSNRLIQILDEESAGLIAQFAERHKGIGRVEPC